MKAVTKYKFQEGVFIVSFFLVVFIISLFFSDAEDVPVLRSIIGAICLGTVTSWYEIVIAVKIQKRMNTLFFILVNIAFYYFVFSMLLIGYGYINLVFKQGLTFAQSIEVGISEIYPLGFHFMIFYLFIFLFLLQMIRQLRVMIVRGLGKTYVRGRLNNPVSATRIFLFMDLYSSTEYAEKLGHSVYSRFIKEIYEELDEYILATCGTLYQFVGDQVVLVWNMKDGFKNNNAVRFFFLVESALNEKREHFLNQYGIVPKFKAGLHYGEVSITEVGNVLKREIAYHGDTVNTSSRICSKCSEINEKILLSGNLADLLSAKNNTIRYESVGKFTLKGKKNGIELFKINVSDEKEIVQISPSNTE